MGARGRGHHGDRRGAGAATARSSPSSARWSTPARPVPEAITELTGISDQMLTSAPPVDDVLPGLLAFAEGSVLTAHNAPFDLRFLTAACAAMGRDWPGFEVLDTVRLARHLMATPQEVPDRKLATLARFFGTPVRPSHRALDDARATAVVLGRAAAPAGRPRGKHDARAARRLARGQGRRGLARQRRPARRRPRPGPRREPRLRRTRSCGRRSGSPRSFPPGSACGSCAPLAWRPRRFPPGERRRPD